MNRDGCDGKHFNLDLYVKGAVIRTTTTTTKTVTSTTHSVHPKVDMMLEKIKELEEAIATGDADAEFAAIKVTLDAAGTQIKEQAAMIYDLTVKFVIFCTCARRLPPPSTFASHRRIMYGHCEFVM